MTSLDPILFTHEAIQSIDTKIERIEETMDALREKKNDLVMVKKIYNIILKKLQK